MHTGNSTLEFTSMCINPELGAQAVASSVAADKWASVEMMERGSYQILIRTRTAKIFLLSGQLLAQAV
jgi:hypothetical protein